jgi:hypothetical protein
MRSGMGLSVPVWGEMEVDLLHEDNLVTFWVKKQGEG